VRAVVVANPKAGGVSDEVVDEVARACAEADVSVVRTGAADGDASARVRGALEEVGSPLDLVVAVGGDGTVCATAEAVARLGGSWPGGAGGAGSPALAVVPRGSGNSAYPAVWGDRPWAEVLGGALNGGATRRIDLLRLEDADEAALLGVNFGLLAEIAVAIERVKAEEPGLPRDERYGRAFLEASQGFRSFEARVAVDGRVIHEGPATFVSVGGVRAFGGGNLSLLPRAEVDDGLLDVCVVPGTDSPELFAEVAGLVAAGKHLERPEVAYEQGRRVSVERTDGEPLALEHDGDPQPARAAVELTIVGGAVPVPA
jgi:diacylglycerol kinase (ATP)